MRLRIDIRSMIVIYSTQPCTLRADHHYSESLTEKWPKNPKLTNINALLIIRGFDSGFKMLEQNLVTLPLEAHTVLYITTSRTCTFVTIMSSLTF